MNWYTVTVTVEGSGFEENDTFDFMTEAKSFSDAVEKIKDDLDVC